MMFEGNYTLENYCPKFPAFLGMSCKIGKENKKHICLLYMKVTFCFCGYEYSFSDLAENYLSQNAKAKGQADFN